MCVGGGGVGGPEHLGKTSLNWRALSQVSEIARGPSVKVILHETIRNDDF